MDIALVIGALAVWALLSVIAGTNVPTNPLWRMIRDALYAFITWLMLSGVAIYELGLQPGVWLAEALGILFLICFAALRFKEIVGYVATRGERRRYRQPPPPPDMSPGSAATAAGTELLSEMRDRVGGGSADLRKFGLRTDFVEPRKVQADC